MSCFLEGDRIIPEPGLPDRKEDIVFHAGIQNPDGLVVKADFVVPGCQMKIVLPLHFFGYPLVQLSGAQLAGQAQFSIRKMAQRIKAADPVKNLPVRAALVEQLEGSHVPGIAHKALGGIFSGRIPVSQCEMYLCQSSLGGTAEFRSQGGDLKPVQGIIDLAQFPCRKAAGVVGPGVVGID